jgi:hypothetical protein
VSKAVSIDKIFIYVCFADRDYFSKCKVHLLFTFQLTSFSGLRPDRYGLAVSMGLRCKFIISESLKMDHSSTTKLIFACVSETGALFTAIAPLDGQNNWPRKLRSRRHRGAPMLCNMSAISDTRFWAFYPISENIFLG